MASLVKENININIHNEEQNVVIAMQLVENNKDKLSMIEAICKSQDINISDKLDKITKIIIDNFDKITYVDNLKNITEFLKDNNITAAETIVDISVNIIKYIEYIKKRVIILCKFKSLNQTCPDSLDIFAKDLYSHSSDDKIEKMNIEFKTLKTNFISLINKINPIINTLTGQNLKGYYFSVLYTFVKKNDIFFDDALETIISILKKKEDEKKKIKNKIWLYRKSKSKNKIGDDLSILIKLFNELGILYKYQDNLYEQEKQKLEILTPDEETINLSVLTNQVNALIEETSIKTGGSRKNKKNNKKLKKSKASKLNKSKKTRKNRNF